MELRIGENIRRLRKAKKVAQEQIAEVLGISVTAVSKWERMETYPDITLLFPLAHYFGVTVDELMGYDEERIQAEIDETLAYYRSLWMTEPEKARKIIQKAYRDYPNDYLVMHYYMWNIAGDMADNEAEVLLANKEEFLAICEKILSGCTEEVVRLNAWNMKAKILHAEGKTEEALQIYREKYPTWYDTRDQKIEQLFAKDTPEFKRYLSMNRYELAKFSVDKKMKDIWFCREVTIKEKTELSFALADALEMFGKSTGDEEAVLLLSVVYTCLEGYLYRFNAFEEFGTVLKEKKAAAEKACENLAKQNEYVKEYMDRRR